MYKEQDPARHFFVVAKGRLTQTRRGNITKEIREKQTFGERALINDYPREDTIISNTEVFLYSLDRITF